MNNESEYPHKSNYLPNRPQQTLSTTTKGVSEPTVWYAASTTTLQTVVDEATIRFMVAGAEGGEEGLDHGTPTPTKAVLLVVVATINTKTTTFPVPAGHPNPMSPNTIMLHTIEIRRRTSLPIGTVVLLLVLIVEIALLTIRVPRHINHHHR
jgi:hypothetical protein